MSEIKPSSLQGIKRLAKSIKVEKGIQHVKALDEAAKIAGYQNFRHADAALSRLQGALAAVPIRQLFITAYWRARDGSGSGRETLSIFLSVPWLELIAPAQLLNHRALRLFKKEGPDHIVRREMADSQLGARSNICAAVRAFQFMDATKLRPSRRAPGYFSGSRSVSYLPGADHTSVWFDPLTKRYLVADEPYEKAVEEKARARQAWADRNGFLLVKPEWPGMYAPRDTQLYLLADSVKGVPLEAVVKALAKASVSFTDGVWAGDSAPILPHFASPGTLSKPAKPPKAKVARGPTGPRNSVAYTYSLVGPARRPDAPLPIEKHREVGKLLKSVMASTYNRKGVYNRLNAIRSELDEWAQCEYSRVELPDDEFFELYYRESGNSFAWSLAEAECNQHTMSLHRAKEILVGSYPDCAPLRALVRKIDSATKSLQCWMS